ncbi:unnamed protein product [Gadus morhua 'NCC']
MENRLKTDWLEERVETRDTLGQSCGRQLKRNPNDLKRKPKRLEEETQAELGRRGRARKGTLTTAANPVKI